MKQELFTTPILFMIFNRPDTTERVFQQIRAIKPKYLFVSADGPRLQKAGEAERCTQARAIIKQVDWDCELKTKFSEKNQGCKVSVSSAITWFFENVEEGIILEDDCLPDLSFFKFCQELLERYRNDQRIMHISGNNFQDGRRKGTGSYYASSLNHVWGWATWKRAWKKYDVTMAGYADDQDRFFKMFPDATIRNYWQKNFDLVYTNRKDTWDVQWQYTMFLHRGLALHPNVNLVSNIGFQTGATHTIDDFDPMANRKSERIEDMLQHPKILEPDTDADRYTFKTYFHPPKVKKALRLIRRYLSLAMR
jgi:hypothetical protein